MKIYSEREAEEFLGENGFQIIEGHFFNGEKELNYFLKSSNFPLVMKVSGDKILHKKTLGGVKLNLSNSSSAIGAFEELMNIKDAEGVLVQRQISGIELLFGIKETPEFGHVLVFGQGGSLVEKLADVSFRVCPVNNVEVKEMIFETEVGKLLKEKEIKLVIEDLMKLALLVDKFPQISELDINPLILTPETEDFVVDARISMQ